MVSSRTSRLALVIAVVAMLVPFGSAQATHLGQPTLNVEPETQIVSTTSGATFLLLTATISSARTTSTFVDFEGVGANAVDAAATPGTPDATCTIAGDGAATSCQAAVPIVGAGKVAEETIFYGWISPNASGGACEADRHADGCQVPGLPAGGSNEGRDEIQQPGQDIEADQTDVVSATFTQSAATSVVCTVSNSNPGVGQPVTATCNIKDQNGQNTAGLIDAEIISSPSGADTGPDDSDEPPAFLAPPEDDNCGGNLATSVNTCIFTFAANTAGTIRAAFWADLDNDAEVGATLPDGNSAQPAATVAIVTINVGATGTPVPTAVPTPVGQTPVPTVNPNPGPGTESGTVFRVSRSGRLRGLRRITVQDVGSNPNVVVASATSTRGGRYSMTLPAGTYTKTAFDRRGRYVCHIGSQGGPTSGTVVITAGGTTIVDIFCER